jgi:hypothetical protein
MGDHSSNLLLVIVCVITAPIIYYWTEVARRKRQQIAFKLRRVRVYLLCLLIGTVVLTQIGYSQRDAVVFSIFLGLSAAFIVVRPPKSDRRVPKSVRRAVIARDLKGVPFNPELHHIDHIVPFSKGGDHSEENVRVMPQSDNLRRGARMPKFKDFR